MNGWSVTIVTKKRHKDWMQNLLSYSNTGGPRKCSFCNSEDIKAYTLKIGRESLNFECKSCGAFAHFDGALTANSDR